MAFNRGLRTAFALALLACSLASVAHAFSLAQNVGFVRDQFRGSANAAAGDVAGDDAGELWFENQILDHFDGSKVTWRQRYFMNDTFYNATAEQQPVVFLCVGGEGPALQPTVVVTGGVHCAWMIHLAEKYGALIVAVEHRFYGKSMPKPDYTVESLKYLSSRQAQADLDVFQSFVTQKYAIPEQARWVTFGGSYPGMMAAWARLLYPQSFFASVSSSAPVEAMLNMQGYNDVVAYSMNDTTVGGSPACLSSIKEAFAWMGDQISSGSNFDLLNMGSKFNVCDKDDLLDPENHKVFLEAFWGLFPLQSNDPSCEGDYCNYEKICEFFTTETSETPQDKLAYLAHVVFGGQCVDIKYSDMIADLKDTSSQDRSWIWQTCTEFGFYQTCDPGTECPFTTSPWLSTAQSYLDICSQAFGIHSQAVTQAILESNEFYSGWKYNGTNVFFLNGDVDPWHANSVLEANNKYQLALMVEGASHHAWTHPPRPGRDQKSVEQAREAIELVVGSWIGAFADDGTHSHHKA